MVVKQITVDTAWHCRPVCHRLYTSSPKHQSNYSISRKWRHFRLCNNAFSYYDNKATCQVNSIKDRRHDHTNCLRKHKRLCASVSHLDYYPTTCSRPADSVVNRPQWTFYSLPSQRSTARSLAITSHTELLQQSTTISATTTGSKTDRQTDRQCHWRQFAILSICLTSAFSNILKSAPSPQRISGARYTLKQKLSPNANQAIWLFVCLPLNSK